MRRSVTVRSSVLIVVLVMAVCPLATAAGPAQSLGPVPGDAELAGEITTGDGSPAAGARVRIMLMDHPETAQEFTTDSNGRFGFEALVHGYYRIAVEHDGQVFAGNRILMVPPGREVEANFQLTEFDLQDDLLGLGPSTQVPGMAKAASGVARLEERIGPSGWAWFRTGKGVAVLVGGGALLVAALIALSESGNDNPVSPINP